MLGTQCPVLGTRCSVLREVSSVFSQRSHPVGQGEVTVHPDADTAVTCGHKPQSWCHYFAHSTVSNSSTKPADLQIRDARGGGARAWRAPQDTHLLLPKCVTPAPFPRAASGTETEAPSRDREFCKARRAP